MEGDISIAMPVVLAAASAALLLTLNIWSSNAKTAQHRPWARRLFAIASASALCAVVTVGFGAFHSGPIATAIVQLISTVVLVAFVTWILAIVLALWDASSPDKL